MRDEHIFKGPFTQRTITIKNIVLVEDIVHANYKITMVNNIVIVIFIVVMLSLNGTLKCFLVSVF